MAAPPCNIQIGSTGISFSIMVSEHPFLFAQKCVQHINWDISKKYLPFELQNPEKAGKKDWKLLLIKEHQGQLELKCNNAHNLILRLHVFLKKFLLSPFLYRLLLSAVKRSFMSQISGLRLQIISLSPLTRHFKFSAKEGLAQESMDQCSNCGSEHP